MSKVFLVQSVDTGTFRKLTKGGFKTHDFDCCAPVATYYVCQSKVAAVEDCRRHNREETSLRYFVNEVHLY